MEGLRGVFVATLINGTVTEDNMRSVITFDKGGTWELLQPPAADSLGGTIDCKVMEMFVTQQIYQINHVTLLQFVIMSH